MQEPNAEVVDLGDYRNTKYPIEGPLDTSDTQQLINEIAFHLLKAIQAVKKLSH